MYNENPVDVAIVYTRKILEAGLPSVSKVLGLFEEHTSAVIRRLQKGMRTERGCKACRYNRNLVRNVTRFRKRRARGNGIFN